MTTIRRDPTPLATEFSWRSWATFLAGFAVLYGVLAVTSAFDATGTWGLAILAAVVVTAVLLETVMGGTSSVGVSGMLRRIGLGRPAGRSVAVAGVVSGLVLLVYPATWALTGEPLQLQPNWIWLLLGLFAFHWLAEELVWRGYAFRRLRAGRSFWRAVWLTMPLVAATHIPIMFTLGPAIGLGAMLVAAVTTIPFSYLYETGGGTVWAPAIVHTAIDTFKLVAVPAAALSTFSPLLIACSILIPLGVLAVPRRFLEAGRHPSSTKVDRAQAIN